jgi:hypothetical protein
VSDDMNMSGEEPIVPEGTVAPLPAPPLIKPGMARRNILLIIASVIVLVVLIGFVVAGFLIAGSTTANLPGNAPVTVVPGGPTTGSTGTTGSATPTGAIPPVPPVSNDDAFSPRNPFSPIPPIAIVSATTVDDSTNTSSTAGNNNDDNTNTLTLQDIVTENSVLKAVVKLNGHTYTLAAGEQVGSSNWSISEVHSDYIVALFGDVSVTLHLGQGSSK